MPEIIERVGLENLQPYQGGPQLPGIIMDANENAFPMPKQVSLKVQDVLAKIAFNRYPQIDAAELRGLLAQGVGLDTANIQVGNGSSELLHACAYAFGGEGRKLSYIYPSFSMYKIYAQLSGSVDCPFTLERDFSLDFDKLKNFLQKERPAILFICNPNNPTGNYYDTDELFRVIKEVDGLVLLDEAYMEFAGEEYSMFKYLSKLPNAAILRTFSKAYGLASGRVGYIAATNRKIIDILGKVLLPYHVNALSLAVAQVVYQNRNFYKECISSIIKERDEVSAALSSFGYTVYPSKTNFIFFSADDKTGELVNFLGERGIILRSFATNPDLRGIRMTMGTGEENEKALAQIKEFLIENAGGI